MKKLYVLGWLLLSFNVFGANDISSNFDWRNISNANTAGLPSGNYVTSVKNQAVVKLPSGYTIPDDVDTCWAFGTIAAVESRYHIDNKTPVTSNSELNLSEQYLVSTGHYSICDKNGKIIKPHGDAFPGDDYGGDPSNAFAFLKDKGGVVLDRVLPYYADLFEHIEEIGLWPVKAPTPKYSISNWFTLCNGVQGTGTSTEKLKTALCNNGPFVAMIKVYYPDIRQDKTVTSLYTTGDWYWKGTQYNKPNYKTNKQTGLPINWDGHIVSVIGYQDSNKDNLNNFGGGYWIVKNSYGKNWGNDVGKPTETLYNGYGLIPYNILLDRGYILGLSGSINESPK